MNRDGKVVWLLMQIFSRIYREIVVKMCALKETGQVRWERLFQHFKPLLKKI